MADEPKGLEPQEGMGVTPPEGEPKNDKPPYEVIEKQLKEKSDKEAKYRIEARDAKAALEAKTTELDTLKKGLGIVLGTEKADGDLAKATDDKIKQTDTRAKTALVKAEFKVAAIKSGLDPDKVDDAFKLANLSGVTVDLETLEVDGLQDVVKSLREGKAYLFTPKGKEDVGAELQPGKSDKSYPAVMVAISRESGQPIEWIEEKAKEFMAKHKDKYKNIEAAAIARFGKPTVVEYKSQRNP